MASKKDSFDATDVMYTAVSGVVAALGSLVVTLGLPVPALVAENWAALSAVITGLVVSLFARWRYNRDNR